MIPTSAQLDAHLAMMVRTFGVALPATLRADLLTLRRLQHEASTQPVVFDLDRYRRIREEAGMACHDDDPEAA